jgi:hypothetical protein
MTLDINQIILETVTVRLNSKKITNSILDQIPRKDFCGLLFDENGDFIEGDNIEIVCRFSLVSLLNSERRVYKAEGYNKEQTHRAMQKYDYQSEAFFFTVDGQLYCDSFSLKTGTKQYSENHAKIKFNISRTEDALNDVNCLLKLHNQGLKPNEVIKKGQYGKISLPKGLPRRTSRSKYSRENISMDWDEDLEAFDEEITPETKASRELAKQSKELNKIIEQYGSWPNYISEMEFKSQSLLAENVELNNDVRGYENRISELISDIISKPFALLG